MLRRLLRAALRRRPVQPETSVRLTPRQRTSYFMQYGYESPNDTTKENDR